MWYECKFNKWTDHISLDVFKINRADWNDIFPTAQVEFDTPVGYQEPQRPTRNRNEDEDAETNEHQNHYDTDTFFAFSGEGNRLDGKKKKCDKPEPPAAARVSLACKHFLHLINQMKQKMLKNSFGSHYSRMFVEYLTTIIHTA